MNKALQGFRVQEVPAVTAMSNTLLKIEPVLREILALMDDN